MSIAAWQVITVILLCFGTLIATSIAADAVLLAGVVILLLLDVLTPQEAFGGMANEGLVTVGVLFIVARGMSQTGVVDWLSQSLLGRPKNISLAQLRLMGPVAALSALLNNTPVVAMLIPAVQEWAKRLDLSVSQLMIPLSYAAIIGGTCTLIGTSTNLVVNGLLTDVDGIEPLRMFDLAWVGIPCVIVVIGFVMLTSRWLLPNRKGTARRFEDIRQYVVEMMVEEGSPVIGKSIEEAGLRQLPGVYLVEINRGNRLITAVSPREILLANDRLVFAGDVRSVVDLKNMRGLRIAEDQAFKINATDLNRCLVEAVVSNNFPTLGKSVKEGNFRNRYGAAIIAVARGGEHINQRIGDIVLKPGDTLLLEAHEQFLEQQRYSRDFLMVAAIEDSRPVQHHRRNVAATVMLLMVVFASLGWLTMLEAACLAAGALLALRCLTVQDARRCIDWQVLVVIASAFALGTAMEKSGAANALAQTLLSASANSPLSLLIIVFAVTALFSALITNVAAALLMFPIVMSATQELGVSILPFAVTLMIAASTCFATPIGYQTNLMVYAPGEYRFVDFLRIGLPLTALVGIVTVIIVPMVWPF